MKAGVRGWLICLTSLVMAGCASMASLPSGAKKIVITEKPVAKHCTWITRVSYHNPGHAQLTPYQHAMLERDEFNHLRLQAYHAGGNLVFLSEYRMVKQGKKSLGQKVIETHTLVGEVYRCPAN